MNKQTKTRTLQYTGESKHLPDSHEIPCFFITFITSCSYTARIVPSLEESPKFGMNSILDTIYVLSSLIAVVYTKHGDVWDINAYKKNHVLPLSRRAETEHVFMHTLGLLAVFAETEGSVSLHDIKLDHVKNEVNIKGKVQSFG